MDKHLGVVRRGSRQFGFLLGLFAGCSLAAAAPSGEAILAAHVGKVEARLATDSVHTGRTETQSLSDGQALGEGASLSTDKDGRACMVLSPGAVLCVAPQSALTFSQLRHVSEGLPQKESDLTARMHIALRGGAILIHAAAPMATREIEVKLPDGGVVASSGGTFSVIQLDGNEWAVISESGDHEVVSASGERVAVREGEALRADASGNSRIDPDLLNIPERQFEVCEAFFDDFAPFIEHPRQFDRAGLGQYLTGRGIDYVGPVDNFRDVSPSIRQSREGSVALAPPSVAAPQGERWSPSRIRTWYEQIGVVKGVNYIPRNAVNSTAFWMAEGFDPDIIEEELGWAQDAGFTSVRVQLQALVWQNDREGFKERFEKFLELADQQGLSVVPVLFDDRNVAGQDPALGTQPEPVPGKHNSRWTPSPGPAAVKDRTAWPQIEQYVRDVASAHRRDDRVLFWDLYNRPGDDGLGEDTLPLMAQVFKWMRDVDPRQPLAVAAWSDGRNAMNSWMLEQSDLITFHSFESVDQVKAELKLLQRYERPVICSDWLMRQAGNDFENVLPVFADHRVGWFSRGLVRGKSQQWIQEDGARAEASPEVWQHDVFNEKGEPYSDKELRLIGEFRFE